MTWPRFIGRNHLRGDYVSGLAGEGALRGFIAGDARRLERDTRDGNYGAAIARAAGVEPDIARRVLDAFFNDAPFPGRWPADFTPAEPEEIAS